MKTTFGLLHIKTTAKELHVFKMAHAQLPYSYTDLGITKASQCPEGFDRDETKVLIGHGEADFHKAKTSIAAWKMFPASWTNITTKSYPVEGLTVIMTAKWLGLPWNNPCRVLYVVNESNRYGFAYGTLPNHVEMGEELFEVSIEPNGDVYYRIVAVSKPRWWAAKLAYPIMRQLQARFRKDSSESMQEAVRNNK
jgi:uncharacterized protein (UPF0548 family)